MLHHSAYSYKDNPEILAWDDHYSLLVFDQECVMCHGFVRFVARYDTQDRFRFTTADGLLGQALFRHYGLRTSTYETNLLIQDGVAHQKIMAFANTMRRLGGGRSLLGGLRFLPLWLSNPLYDVIAQNRYAIFGRYETCPLPSEDVKRRLID